MTSQGRPAALSVSTPQNPQYEHVLLGYRIPFLPQGPARPELATLSEAEQARDALSTQARLISALAAYPQAAVTLRYFVHPERASGESAINLVLLVRASAEAGKARAVALTVGERLQALLAQARVTADPMTDEAHLRAQLAPTGLRAVCEIRQREDVVPLRVGDAYAVSPWSPTMSTWLPALNMFLSQNAPFVVNVHLEPTQLTADERSAFAQAAHRAGVASDLRFEEVGVHYSAADPQAAVVAELYNRAQRLASEPFLIVAQVASPDATVAHEVARSFAPEITRDVPVRASRAPDPLPCGYSVVAPRTEAEGAAAWHTLTMLSLTPWGATPATPAQERLRFLVDAAGAACAFRFPLALRGGLPGINTSRPAGTGGATQSSTQGGEIARNIEGVPPRT